MTVCVCVCVFVCVSGGLTPGPHKPSPRNLAWAQHRARGQPKMLARDPPTALPTAPPTFAP